MAMFFGTNRQIHLVDCQTDKTKLRSPSLLNFRHHISFSISISISATEATGELSAVRRQISASVHACGRDLAALIQLFIDPINRLGSTICANSPTRVHLARFLQKETSSTRTQCKWVRESQKAIPPRPRLLSLLFPIPLWLRQHQPWGSGAAPFCIVFNSLFTTPTRLRTQPESQYPRLSCTLGSYRTSASINTVIRQIGTKYEV